MFPSFCWLWPLFFFFLILLDDRLGGLRFFLFLEESFISWWTSLLELLLLYPIDFRKNCVFIVMCRKVSFLISLWCLHWLSFFNTLFLVSKCLCFSYSFCDWFLVLYCCVLKKMLAIISVFLHLLRLVT